MKHTLLMICIVGILSLPLILALDPSLVFEKNTTVDLKVPCFENNFSVCEGGTECNITIFHANDSILIDGDAMTQTINYFNYTLNPNQTSNDGEYNAVVSCVGNDFGFSTFTYEINPIGIRSTEERSNSLTRALYFIFGIAIILFISFLFKTSPPIKWTFFIFSIIFFLIGFNIISISLADEVVNPRLASFFDAFTAIAFFFYFFAAGLLIIIWFFTFLNEWILQRNLRNARKYGIG